MDGGYKPTILNLYQWLLKEEVLCGTIFAEHILATLVTFGAIGIDDKERVKRCTTPTDKNNVSYKF